MLTLFGEQGDAAQLWSAQSDRSTMMFSKRIAAETLRLRSAKSKLTTADQNKRTVKGRNRNKSSLNLKRLP